MITLCKMLVFILCILGSSVGFAEENAQLVNKVLATVGNKVITYYDVMEKLLPTLQEAGLDINKSSDGKRYYCHCSYYTAHSKYGLCTPHSLNYKKLENIVLEEIRKMCKEYVDSTTFKDKLEEVRKKNDIKVKKQKEINVLDKRIRTNNSYIDKIYEDKLSGIIDMEMFNRLTIKYKDEIVSWKNQRDELEEELKNIDTEDSNKEKEEILKKINEYLSFEKPNRNLLVNLIDKILISEDKIVEIHYKFKLY